MKASDVKAALAGYATPERARANAWFFKSGPGQYGEGDKFVGVRVPDIRVVARQFAGIKKPELNKLFNSPYHEHRLCACLIMVQRYRKAPVDAKDIEFNYYLDMLRAGRINNWDLIDTSTPHIIGDWLMDKPRDLLYELANSGDLWQERAALLACAPLIKATDFTDIFALSEHFLNHPHDLIHKASGWMLREVGKMDEKAMTDWLDQHYRSMPRTTLRYAIERLPETKRQDYLKGRI